MSIQEFPQHYARHLARRGFDSVIKDGKAIVAKPIADQAAHDALIAQADADIILAERRQGKASNRRERRVMVEFIRRMCNQTPPIDKPTARTIYENVEDAIE